MKEKIEDQFKPELYDIIPGEHLGKNVLWIRFPDDKNLMEHLKKFTVPHWSHTEKTWYLFDNKHNRSICNLEIPLVGKDVLVRISPVNFPEFEKYQNMLALKSYSENTIRTYSVEFAQLLYLLKDFPVQDLTPDRLQSYFLYCTKELKLSESQIHSRINAVKFYFEKVLHKDKMFFDIPRPKKPRLLPKSLTIKEIQKLFSVVENPKHLLILKLCYGMGLRVSEIVNLKVEDIDGDRMLVHIQRGKGKKDRFVALPKMVLDDLRLYYKAFRPREFLFEGQYGGQYSVRSAQMVFKKAMKKAKIKKSIGIHGLRHSYATHLLEMGTDISFIQKLLGHNDIKTTMVYTEITNASIANIKSPLDGWEKEK